MVARCDDHGVDIGARENFAGVGGGERRNPTAFHLGGGLRKQSRIDVAKRSHAHLPTFHKLL